MRRVALPGQRARLPSALAGRSPGLGAAVLRGQRDRRLLLRDRGRVVLGGVAEVHARGEGGLGGQGTQLGDQGPHGAAQLAHAEVRPRREALEVVHEERPRVLRVHVPQQQPPHL